jgi:hypothetical protein
MSDARQAPWRNANGSEATPEPEARPVDAADEGLEEVPAAARQVRALISRLDPLSHYKSFENIAFLLSAIGQLDYPRRPAVDVLWRRNQIDDERRSLAKRYVRALEAWVAGQPLYEAQLEDPDAGPVMDQVYDALGPADEVRRWLASCLAKALKEYCYMPWDFIAAADDTGFVRAVYRTILGRDPSPDDLQLRLEQLAAGATREDLFAQVLSAREHQAQHLQTLAAQFR